MVVDTERAYLDHAAAGPLAPPVRAAMARFVDADFGNPESLHDWARAPARVLEDARTALAALIGATAPGYVVFTSGDVEARNLAVKGVAAARRADGSHLVTSAVDHPATLAVHRTLGRDGLDVTLVAVDAQGRVDPQDLANAVRDDTVLVTIAHGQAEIGTIADVPALVAAVRARRPEVTVHLDACLTAGVLDVDAAAWDVDLVSMGGASIGGPRWIGALWVREGCRLHPLIEGGVQEFGKRGGHHDVPAIAGLAVAADLAAGTMDERRARLDTLTATLAAELLSLEGVRLNGPPVGERLPGHLQVSVEGAEAEALTLLLATKGVACSPGSACDAAGKASPVLEAIGLEPPWTHSAVLFTLGDATTAAEVALAGRRFREAVTELRAMRPRTS